MAASRLGQRETSADVADVLPSVSLPKGGGAIRGVGEKFDVQPATGTASLQVPIAASPGRSGSGPQLSLRYDSGVGNGPFGFGWTLDLPAVTRKTDKGLPRYRDADESDVFILSGSEDLVPELDTYGERVCFERVLHGVRYRVHRYRPRVEGLFARIERWVDASSGLSHWRSISRDNVTSLYGYDTLSRIADPEDPRKAFAYLLSRTFDDKGNLTLFDYVADDGRGVDVEAAHEANRSPGERGVQRYLKRVRYGNRLPYYPGWSANGPETPLPEEWLFELVFDYGDHDTGHPRPQPDRAWPARPDAFSSYRPGFEQRTYRRCERALMFHHFPEEPDVGRGCLVRSTDFAYQDQDAFGDPRFPVYSFLRSVTHAAYRRQDGGYRRASLPPVEFGYSQPEIQTGIQSLDDDSLENLPEGVDASRFRWLDLDGEGLPGVLTDIGGAWAYRRNLGSASADGGQAGRAVLGSLRLVAALPARNRTAGQRFLDLSGDGQLDLVALQAPDAGFYERTPRGSWETFRRFRSRPVLDWQDPGLRLADLSGDGLADILLTEDEAFCYYPSEGEDGFGPPERVRRPLDEERGPRVVFGDSTETIFLADMSGDGLADIVRVRNGEVCYWPNRGYGRFGAKVSMDGSPRFTDTEHFDPARVRLADIDGTGTSDLLYVGEDGVLVCFNLSGNAWAAPHRLAVFPSADNLSTVQLIDLLGTGTACLAWSSPLPANARQPLRYVDLLGGRKPHLLTAYRNNLGGETRVRYAPSTRFYLRDQRDGRPWATRLPFPVQVVDRVEAFDWIGRSRLVTRYAYHHGYFDGFEREFRGFGMVEQQDTEERRDDTSFADLDVQNWDPAYWSPPVLTRTWFHTGAFLGAAAISRHYAAEYWHEPGLSPIEREAALLPDTVLPPGLSPAEAREACRALKGHVLRSETYAADGSPRAGNPYTVLEQDFGLRLLQPRGGNRHAVFYSHPRETITYHYERNPADPRTGHTLTLAVDEFGNVLSEVSIAYGRRTADPSLSAEDQATQARPWIIYSEARYTNLIADAWTYRTPLPCETRTYELTGLRPAGARFSFAEWSGNGCALAASAAEIPYEDTAGHLLPQKRLIERVRSLFRRNDLTGLLPLGRAESLALPGESYRLAFTPGLLDVIYRRGDEPLLPDPAAVLAGSGADQGGYVDLDGDGHWWLPSGRVYFSAGRDTSAGQELATARRHFFLPRRHQDAFGQSSTVDYDSYDLLPRESRDPLGNRVTVGERDTDGNLAHPGGDYRVLRPRLVMDANRNRSAVAFDTLGMVVGTAVMGKPGEGLGDSLDGFETDLTDAQISRHLADPRANAAAILGPATTRLIYDLFAYTRSRDQGNPQPTLVHALARETHASDLAPGQESRVQHIFSYSDGFGRQIQQKLQAEPGPLPRRGPDGRITLDAAGQPVLNAGSGPRWVGSGWTVFNNKGKPVRQYEPFFSDTHRFEFNLRVAVSSVLFYDPLQRQVAVLHPDHTWSKIVFDAWHQAAWDVNDTLLADPVTDPDAGPFLQRLARDEYVPTWYELRTDPAWAEVFAARYPEPRARAAETRAAAKTRPHAGTPTLTHVDSLGRAVLTVARNRFERTGALVEEHYSARVEIDAEGNHRALRDLIDRSGDGRGRLVMRYRYDMLGNRLHQASMEAGQRWLLRDVVGNPIRSWDSRGHTMRTGYDVLRRPSVTFLLGETATEQQVQQSVYGETHGGAQNLRGRVYQQFDQAGVITNVAYDFKGNLAETRRQLTQDYRATVDWSASPPLEQDVFTSRTTYDALNRPVTFHPPDGSVIRPVYNEASLLDKIDVNIRSETTDQEFARTPFVAGIDYDAKRRRQRIVYGNGAITTYDYDPLTLRLVHLRTSRGRDHLQDLAYTYDPSGNITAIHDDAQQTVFFRNAVVEPSSGYAYDAVYRLIEATGREHIGQAGHPTPPSWDDKYSTHLAHPGDGQAMRRYHERYAYDAANNIVQQAHHANAGSWTRDHTYQDPSLLDPGQTGNRLSGTTVGSVSERYSYDAHGNMTTMPHLPLMRWNYRDELQATTRQVRSDGGTPETTYCVYDGAGQRIRKVTERQAAPGQAPARKSERIYIGDFEVHREYGPDGTTTETERETLHVLDGGQRIALIENRTRGTDAGPARLLRYQHPNHLDSAIIELDDRAQIISYEEYYPYGSTAYQAVRSQTDTPKRYRYTGKERDEETGLNYHRARYYAPWLGRWTSCDPILFSGKSMQPDGASAAGQYSYGGSNPVTYIDPDGRSFLHWIKHGIERAGHAAADFAAGSLAWVMGESAANAPEPGQTHLESSVSMGEYLVRVVIASAAGGIGEAVAKRVLAETGSKVLAGAAETATAGSLGNVGAVAEHDVLRGRASSLGSYLKALGVGLAIGAIRLAAHGSIRLLGHSGGGPSPTLAVPEVSDVATASPIEGAAADSIDQLESAGTKVGDVGRTTADIVDSKVAWATAEKLGFALEEDAHGAIFYSGGGLEGVSGAKVSAYALARGLGRGTIADTWGGAYLNAVEKLPGGLERSVWPEASAQFSLSAGQSGLGIHVVLPAYRALEGSIWTTIERPILRLANKPIRYHLGVDLRLQ